MYETEVNGIRLNVHGSLEVKRKEAYRKLFCPHRKFKNKDGKDNVAFCGCECSQFGEPTTACAGDGYVALKVCDNVFITKEENFSDEREGI